MSDPIINATATATEQAVSVERAYPTHDTIVQDLIAFHDDMAAIAEDNETPKPDRIIRHLDDAVRNLTGALLNPDERLKLINLHATAQIALTNPDNTYPNDVLDEYLDVIDTALAAIKTQNATLTDPKEQ